MRQIEACANVTVGRACGFAGLGIGAVMMALSYNPPAMAQGGAILTSLLAAVLAWRAGRAPEIPYRRTELWLTLDDGARPPPAYAQRVLGGVLQTTYRHYAALAGRVAAALWLATVLLAMAR